MNVKKRISIITALMMLLTVFAVPSLAYGKASPKAIYPSEGYEGYYISGSATGEKTDYLRISQLNDTMQLAVYDAEGKKVDIAEKGWKWTSDDSDVASVSSDGVVTGESDGWTQINVQNEYGGLIVYMDMYVGDAEYHYVIKSKNGGEIPNQLMPGDSVQLQIGCEPETEDESILEGWTWSVWDIDECQVSDEYVSIDDEGLLTVHKEGIKDICVVAEKDGEVLQTRSIHIGYYYDIVMEDGSEIPAYVPVGKSLNLKLVVKPEGTDNSLLSGVVWNVFDEDWKDASEYATIDKNGVLTVKKAGTVLNIEAESKDGQYLGSLEIRAGNYFESWNGKFKYQVYPDDGTAMIMNSDLYDFETGDVLEIPAEITFEPNDEYDDEYDNYTPGTYKITAIGEDAILGEDITKVEVPNSITSIGSHGLGYDRYINNSDKYIHTKVKDFTIIGYSATSAAAKYAKENGITYINLGKKANQTISGAASFKKAYGSKAFSLGAKTNGNGKLTYKSSNTKVAAVSSAGKVTIKGTGTATITITAAATSEYNAAAKKVTITINPKKVTGLKTKAGKKRMTVSWKKDTKATGYQLTYAQNKKFTKGKKNVTISKNKTVKKTVKKLKSKKTYYVKVRAYKKVGSKKLYGAYSAVKSVKIK